MPEPDADILHVSDTALMVAACRALETERPDGLVRDPFAARLAGERGRSILGAMPRSEIMCFGIGVRSHFMDELVLDAVANHGVRTILSLGCGLDARPYRLDLPASLQWIEVDFADMLAYKARTLDSEKPRCDLERRTADLNDPAQRRELYRAAGNGPAMAITEGLLMYLPASTVEGLAAEMAANGAFRYWMTDVTSPAFSAAIGMSSYQSIRNVQADDHLDGLQIIEAVGRNGWKTEARRSYITDMAFAMPRIQKMMPGRPPGAEPPRLPVPQDDPTGVHRFGR